MTSSFSFQNLTPIPSTLYPRATTPCRCANRTPSALVSMRTSNKSAGYKMDSVEWTHGKFVRKAELPHPVYACVFCTALHFFSNYFG